MRPWPDSLAHESCIISMVSTGLFRASSVATYRDRLSSHSYCIGALPSVFSCSKQWVFIFWNCIPDMSAIKIPWGVVEEHKTRPSSSCLSHHLINPAPPRWLKNRLAQPRDRHCVKSKAVRQSNWMDHWLIELSLETSPFSHVRATVIAIITSGLNFKTGAWAWLNFSS